MSGLRRITPSSWLRLTDGVLESRIIRAAWALVSMPCSAAAQPLGSARLKLQLLLLKEEIWIVAI